MALLLAPVSGAAQDFSFRVEYPCKVFDHEGRLEISLKESSLRVGQSYAVRYTLTNITIPYPVYNWQFDSFKPLPGQLALYDAEKRYVKDLLARTFFSRQPVNLFDWSYLHGGSSVSAPLGFRADLPVGTFYIQLIMYKAFISERPYLEEVVMEDFRTHFDKGELCRSNVIKVEIIR